MYAFSLNVVTGINYQFAGAIMKESAVLDSVYGDYNNDYRSGVSNLVITACSKGERVWIRCLSDGDVVFDNNNAYTTFSGFLLNRL